jgi:hypothetical protein
MVPSVLQRLSQTVVEAVILLRAVLMQQRLVML